MNLNEFKAELWRHGYLHLDEEHEGVAGLFIGKSADTKPDWHIPFWGIEEAPDYDAIMRGRDVKHMTRVVGYYSMTENWNLSKLGELEDRRKGDYSVTNTDTGRHMIAKMKREKVKREEAVA